MQSEVDLLVEEGEGRPWGRERKWRGSRERSEDMGEGWRSAKVQVKGHDATENKLGGEEGGQL